MTHYQMSMIIMAEMKRVKDNPADFEEVCDVDSVLFGLYLAWERLSKEYGAKEAGARLEFGKLLYSMIQV